MLEVDAWRVFAVQAACWASTSSGIDGHLYAGQSSGVTRAFW